MRHQPEDRDIPNRAQVRTADILIALAITFAVVAAFVAVFG